MPPPGRPRSFDRAAALRDAMMVFWAKGYDGASLPDLTAAMGIHSPSLYAAFGSKQELFREALDLYSRTEGHGIWDAVPDAPTAREAIEQLLRASAESFTRPQRPGGCMIGLGELQATDSNEEIRRDLCRLRKEGVEILRRRLERAVRSGELPARVDCAAVASFYTTVQHGLSIRARDGASRDELLAIAESAMAAWDPLTAPDRRRRRSASRRR
jgi:AcrR family transcriptional regulator